MTNDSAIELSYQGEFVLNLLSGGRHNYKNNNLVQGKQTVRAGTTPPPDTPSLSPARVRGHNVRIVGGGRREAAGEGAP